ncbi:MAG TPA: cupin-like domain-containing protein, partial [Longimicrobiales bacterium]|nr:cupin-like domain-containing protein [Longimicrobiales bacterium]
LAPTKKLMAEVDVVDTITPAAFKREYIDTNSPLLMRKVTANWPAMKKWSFDFFASLRLPKRVFLEMNNVLQGGGQYEVMEYEEYIRRIANDSNGEAPKGYLSVFKVFNAFPELRKDVDFSLLSQFKMKNTAKGWIGPAGTVTGYHVDWGDNVLAQIRGRKEVRLVSPADSKYMYPSKRFDQGTMSSEMDVDNLDAERFPLFAKATEYRVVIHPGEMLFIPRGWWHHVRSLDKSISVSNISYDAKGIMVDLLSERVKQVLHDVGIYRVPCTCHIEHNGKRMRRAVAN